MKKLGMCDLCEDVSDTSAVDVSTGKGSGFSFEVCSTCLLKMVPEKLRPENAWRRG